MSGISWKVPSGKVRRIVIGSTPISSSLMAMSIGLAKFLVGSTKIGAPIEIWRALAPTMRARSKRVILGGPIQIFSSSAGILELSSTFSAHSAHPAHSRSTLRWHRWTFRLSRCDYVVDFQNHRCSFGCRLDYLLLDG